MSPQPDAHRRSTSLAYWTILASKSRSGSLPNSAYLKLLDGCCFKASTSFLAGNKDRLLRILSILSSCRIVIAKLRVHVVTIQLQLPTASNFHYQSSTSSTRVHGVLDVEHCTRGIPKLFRLSVGYPIALRCQAWVPPLYILPCLHPHGNSGRKIHLALQSHFFIFSINTLWFSSSFLPETLQVIFTCAGTCFDAEHLHRKPSKRSAAAGSSFGYFRDRYFLAAIIVRV